MIYICISRVTYFNRKINRHHYRARHSTSCAVWYTLRFEPVSIDNCIMRACSTDDICTHATCMLYTITMEMKLFLVPLFYCPCINTIRIQQEASVLLRHASMISVDFYYWRLCWPLVLHIANCLKFELNVSKVSKTQNFLARFKWPVSKFVTQT